MNRVVEVSLVVARELRRNLRSGKGLLLFALSALMATGTAMAVARAERAASEAMEHVKTGRAASASFAGGVANHQFLERIYSPNVADRLNGIPLIVQTMLIGTVALAPAMIAMLAFDSVSSELQFRSVRYWTVRMRRSSFYFGKVLGVFFVAALAIFVANAIACAIVIVRGTSPAAETLEWSATLWLTILPIVLAWCCALVFVSSLARTPTIAFVLSFVVIVSLAMCWGFSHRRDLDWMRWLYPNSSDASLLSSDPMQVAVGLAGCFGFGAVFATMGSVLFQRRDL